MQFTLLMTKISIHRLVCSYTCVPFRWPHGPVDKHVTASLAHLCHREPKCFFHATVGCVKFFPAHLVGAPEPLSPQQGHAELTQISSRCFNGNRRLEEFISLLLVTLTSNYLEKESVTRKPCIPVPCLFKSTWTVWGACVWRSVQLYLCFAQLSISHPLFGFVLKLLCCCLADSVTVKMLIKLLGAFRGTDTWIYCSLVEKVQNTRLNTIC